MPENKLATSSDKGQDNKTAAKTNEKSPDKDDNKGAEDDDIGSDEEEEEEEEEEEAKEEVMSAEETQRQMDVALATRIHRIIVLSILPQLHGTITKKVFYMILFILSVKDHHIKSKSINQRKITVDDTTRQIFKDHEEKKIQQQQSLGSIQV